MQITSDWQFRIQDHTGDDFSPVTFWSYNNRALRDHDDAAEEVAKYLTNSDYGYYETLEHDGVEMEILSPEGETKKMRASGHITFVYSAEEIEEGES